MTITDMYGNVLKSDVKEWCAAAVAQGLANKTGCPVILQCSYGNQTFYPD